MFAILQKYEFSSKSQPIPISLLRINCCLRYCKSTSFQANHNLKEGYDEKQDVVCDTAKVRVFKQITTNSLTITSNLLLFAILQKYEFSSKSQPPFSTCAFTYSCLRYCKSTSFQANHNRGRTHFTNFLLFAILQKYEFSSKSQP